jgi:ATP-dependent RNA helicase RhlE
LIKNQDLSDVLVFQEQNMVQTMSLKLCAKTILAEAIHGDKSQNARQRVWKHSKIKKLAFLWQQI